MIWLLLSFSSSLRVSDKNVRLPIFSEQEGGRPYQIVKFYTKNIEFTVPDPKLIDVEVVSKEYSSTSLNISVKYSDNFPISTHIKFKIGQRNLEYPVYIDIIDHISIVQTATENLTVNHLTPFQVIAYNDKDEPFTSLDGITIEWGPTIGNNQFGLFLPNDEELKVYYDTVPSNYVIIKGVENCITNLTCKLTNQDIAPAIYTLKFQSSIFFLPGEIYTTQSAEIPLNLYYTEDHVNPSGMVNLNGHNWYHFESDSLNVADVSDSGKVTTLDLGDATITVTDQSGLSEPAKAVIHVIYPDRYKWDEQWIKPSDEPDISNVTVFYQNHSVTFSNRCPIRIAKTFQKTGTNNVELLFPDINYSVYGVVHNCPPPVADKEEFSVNVGEANYQFKIIGGSGFFDVDFDGSLIEVEELFNIEGGDGKVVSTFSLSALKAGKSVIKINDQKIDGYKIELNVDSVESHEL